MNSASGDETPTKAKVIIDPGNPKAGKGGVLPPHPPFDGSKPGPGRPKGSHSARAALQRKWRKGWETDSEAQEGEEKLGIEARRVADEAHGAALAGNSEKVRALTSLIDQAEGKPQERVEHSGGATTRIVHVSDVETGDVPLPGEEGAS